MNEKTCGNCRLFIPYVDQYTKRVRPSEPGRCGWTVPWPKDWPIAFFHRRDWSSLDEWPTAPTSGPVSKWRTATECKFWEPKGQPKPQPTETQETFKV